MAKRKRRKVGLRQFIQIIKETPEIVFWRFLTSSILVLASFNPFGISFYHWAIEQPGLDWTVGAVLFFPFFGICYCIYVTIKGLPWLFRILVLAGCVILVGLAFQEGWVTKGSAVSLQWLGIIIVTGVFTIGRSFAKILRIDSGQIMGDMDGS